MSSESRILLTLIGMVVTTSGCTSNPLVWRDPRYEVDRYRTYRWVGPAEVKELNLTRLYVEGPSSEPVRIVERPDLERRLRPLVERGFREQGLLPSGAEPPDFYVTFYGKAADEDWVSSWSGMTAALVHVPLAIFPEYDGSRAREFRDGDVYLTLYDRRSKRPAWTATVNRKRYGRFAEEERLSAEIGDLTAALKRSRE